jgi:hypothetical protein
MVNQLVVYAHLVSIFSPLLVGRCLMTIYTKLFTPSIRQLCDFRHPLKLLKSRDTEDFGIWQTPCLTGTQRVGSLKTRMDRNQKRSQPKGFSNEP